MHQSALGEVLAPLTAKSVLSALAGASLAALLLAVPIFAKDVS
jgi:hypothetical protein